jgi:hypothetical protein
VFFGLAFTKIPPSVERPPNLKEVRMDSSPFEFDVVTGPVPPRDERKEKPREGGGEKTEAGERDPAETPSSK